MAKQIDIMKTLVNEYDVADIVNFCLNMHLVGHDKLRKAIDTENLGYAGEAESCFKRAEEMLKALDSKLNGEKEKTVL